jgi:hypothetical protein
MHEAILAPVDISLVNAEIPLMEERMQQVSSRLSLLRQYMDNLEGGQEAG